MSGNGSATHFDVIVLGVGSMGSAACCYLARRGQKVLGLEQFTTPHENGSHAGQSRIIRKAYFEHPDYVPLLERAYENWRTIGQETSTTIYHRTGIVYFGKPGHENIEGIRTSSRLHDIPIENWTYEQSRQRFPSFNIPSGFDVIYEPDAGFVTPERAIEMYVREARRSGAVIETQSRVLSWRQEGGKIRVVTTENEFTAGKLVITAGAWTSQLIPKRALELRVTRQFLAWVETPDPEEFAMGKFPCWFVEDPALGTFYGFPSLPQGVFGGPTGLKLAHHHPGAECSADETHTAIPVHEEQKLKEFLKTYLPSAGSKIISTKRCLYTYSRDAHFIIDHLPGYGKRVAIACGFSGHGFKFVSVVGEILADLVTKESTDLPIDFLRTDRF